MVHELAKTPNYSKKSVKAIYKDMKHCSKHHRKTIGKTAKMTINYWEKEDE